MGNCVRITRCRCCGGDRLEPLLDLGDMPLANSFHNGAGDCPRFPLALMTCPACHHGQTSVAVPRERLFTDYPYLSGMSRVFREHCRKLVGVAKLLVPGVSRPRVLDIASNDGLLLSLFAEAGCEVLGVEPAANLKPLAKALGVPTLTAFWTAEFAAILRHKHDLITAQNVLAHVDDPYDFLIGCHRALADGGAVIVEVPWFMELLLRNEFDTIYHEHLSYFLAHSFAKLVERTPLYIEDIYRVPVHGGSLRFTLRKRGEGQATPRCFALGDFLHTERFNEVGGAETHERFRTRVARNGADLREWAASCRGRGERVIGFGASAKGTVAINHFGLNLDYVVDDTPTKQGKYIPGTRIPVVPADALRTEPDRVNIVVLAWNWLDEIRARVRTLRGAGDRLLVYVPGVRVEEVR